MGVVGPERVGGWRAESLLAALPQPALLTDLSGVVLYANPPAQAFLGGADEPLAGRSIGTLLSPSGEAGDGRSVVAALIAEGTWRPPQGDGQPPGAVAAVRVTGGAVMEETGDCTAVVVVVERVVHAASDADLVAHLVGIAQVAAELGSASDLSTVAEVVCSHAAEVLGANGASLALLVAPGTLELVGARGGPPGAEARWARFDIGETNPASEAARTGVPVTVVGREDMIRRYPDLFPDEAGDRSLVSLPLAVSGGCVGVITLSFGWRYEFAGPDRQFLQTLADTCAQAVARVTAVAAERDRTGQLEFLARASAALASSLDYEATLRGVADLVVPSLADWCGIDVLEDGALRPVAVAHMDPAKIALAAELRERYPVDMSDVTGAPAVVRTGESQLYTDISDELLEASAVDPEHLALIRQLALRSLLMVPLDVHGRTLGVLTLVSSGARRYHDLDVVFAEELGRRAGVAIDNAQLHSETLAASLSLQRAVLPASFDDISGWRVAVHYHPAGRTEVGGDFYDAVPLPDGRLVVLVGDVMGRGVPAAAAMAQVRSAVRAYLAIDPNPITVIQRLAAMFTMFDTAPFVTLLYGLIDPTAGTLTLVSAGHLPPLLINADGRVQSLPVPSSPPLGVGEFTRTAAIVPFGNADTVLMVTDGAVERRGEDLDVGIERLAVAAARLTGELSDAVLGTLAQEMTQPHHDDDVTMIAVRRLT